MLDRTRCASTTTHLASPHTPSYRHPMTRPAVTHRQLTTRHHSPGRRASFRLSKPCRTDTPYPSQPLRIDYPHQHRPPRTWTTGQISLAHASPIDIPDPAHAPRFDVSPQALSDPISSTVLTAIHHPAATTPSKTRRDDDSTPPIPIDATKEQNAVRYQDDEAVKLILDHGGAISKEGRVYFACRFVAACSAQCKGAAEYFPSTGSWRCLHGTGFNGTRQEIFDKMPLHKILPRRRQR
jgi:hypothetical protein